MTEQIISPGVFQNESDQSAYTQGPQVIGAAIVGPTVKGIPMVPTYVTTYSQFQSIFGESFKSGSYYYEYFTSLAAKDYFSNGGQTLLVTKIISGSSNLSTYASSTVPAISGATTASFTLETLAWGNQMNNTSSMVSGALASGSAENVRWEVTNVATASGVFNIVVRRGDDNDAQKNILETWANVSLDPQQPNYISRIIGDSKPVYDVTNGYVNYTGSFVNSSQYVRVASVVVPQVDSIDNNGNYKAATYSGSLPALGSGSYGGSFSGGVAATGRAQLMNETITTANIQGFAPVDYTTAFTLLQNADEYQYNILIAPGIGLDTSGASLMISTVEGRGDAIAIVDNGIYGTSLNGATTNAGGSSSNSGAYAGGSASPSGQGNAGGASINGSNPNFPSGGGGGAGAVGGVASSVTQSGSGGNGLASSITGTSITRGGGGGGAGFYNTSNNAGATTNVGAGGSGGGGSGVTLQVDSPISGTANTGGGGGGLSNGVRTEDAGSGGSGVVIIRYADNYGDIITIGGGLTYAQTITGGYKIYEFTSGTDTITF